MRRIDVYAMVYNGKIAKIWVCGLKGVHIIATPAVYCRIWRNAPHASNILTIAREYRIMP